MTVDRRVERAVRKALAGSVAGEGDRFDAAVTEIARTGDDFANKAFDLVFRIDSAALFSIHNSERPDDEQLRILSEDFARQEFEWAGVNQATALTFLTAIADVKSPLEALPVSDALIASYAIGGWLLSAFIGDDDWTDFLDAILDKIDKLPD